jgi:hypothetical protein
MQPIIMGTGFNSLNFPVVPLDALLKELPASEAAKESITRSQQRHHHVDRPLGLLNRSSASWGCSGTPDDVNMLQLYRIMTLHLASVIQNLCVHSLLGKNCVFHLTVAE